MKLSRFAPVMFVLALGCAGTADATTATAPGTVNANCVMKPGQAVKEGVTAEFEGEMVGFCCSNCSGKWDKLPDAEKTVMLAAAKAK